MSGGINFAFPLNEERFRGKSRPKKMAYGNG